MTEITLAILFVMFVIHLEVKCRERERDSDSEKLKGSDDDVS
ncbi:hypothetical protein SAMN05216358_0028 [Rhizobium sp. AN5]|nr:hypothetical protein [Rhizobium sp. AN5]SOC90012.1 hypothetical protein SAMN05216358_0028 [Rhizobium sp. AN5]